MLVRQEGLWKFWPITATEVGKSGVTEDYQFRVYTWKFSTNKDNRMSGWCRLTLTLHQYNRRSFEFPYHKSRP